MQKIRLPTDLLSDREVEVIVHLCWGASAFGFGRVLQDLMIAYLAGKESRSQIALTSGPGAGSGEAHLPGLGGA